MAGVLLGWPLVGRGEEMAVLDRHVGDHRGALVVAGPMGVGKSRLMAGWLSGWEARGRPAVVVRATKSTATIPFGAFARWVPEHLGTARHPLSVLQATAARLAPGGTGPVIAVDDAQMLDEASAALVLHLAQHGSCRLLVTVRTGEPCPDAVVALWKEGIARRLDLPPLSEPETVELLERALGDPVSPASQRRLWHLSQGNPLYLGELVDAARSQGVLARAEGAWRWQGGLTGRTRLAELVSNRIAAGGREQRRLLELVALGEPLPVAVLERLAPRDLLTDLEAGGLVVVDDPAPGDAGGAARLAHPLYSEVLRAAVPAFRARGHYAALADAAIAAGTQRHDPLRAATWMIDGGKQPEQPDLLLRASLLANGIDEFELSARLAAAAERAGGGWRATLRRAEALGPLRRWGEADALLASLSSPGRDPDARAAAAAVRGEQAFWLRGEDLAGVRADVAAAAETIPAPARSPVLVYAARLALAALDLEESIRLATAAAADAGSLVDRLNALTSAGFAAAFLGRTRAATAIVAAAGPRASEVARTDPTPSGYVAYTHSFASVLDGRVDEAADFFEAMLARRQGRLGGSWRAMPAFWLSRARLVQGRVRTAARLAQEAIELHGDANLYGRGTWAASVVGMAASQAGDVATAAAAVAWADAHAPPCRVEADDLFLDLARSWVRAARGERSAARHLALDAAHRARKAGAWAIELMILTEALRFDTPGLTPRLEELAHLVEGPYATTTARFAGAAAGRDGPALDEAAAAFGAIGLRLHAAEAAALAADAHAAAGDRRSCAASLAAAERWAAVCEGATTPRLASIRGQGWSVALTEREREVAELAARGLTSREIARTLAISVRTVDSHLGHAYTKLGIGDRRELPDVLGLSARALRRR